jgi:hypothetical protein
MAVGQANNHTSGLTQKLKKGFHSLACKVPAKGVHCCKSQFHSVLSANDFVPEEWMAFVEGSAIRSPSFCCKSQVKL